MFRVKKDGQWYVSLDGEHYLPVSGKPHAHNKEEVISIFARAGYAEDGAPVQKPGVTRAMCFSASAFADCKIEEI